ncbi:hypothetical protein [Moorena producens]|uniref:hypothetical protein n=1 Tax=Moorena producens TaxID=1155739 RepID=UPI003C71940C
MAKRPRYGNNLQPSTIKTFNIQPSTFNLQPLKPSTLKTFNLQPLKPSTFKPLKPTRETRRGET